MADVTFVVDSETAKAFRAYQKLIDKQREATRAAVDGSAKSRRAADDFRGGLDATSGAAGKLVTGLKGMVTGLIGAGGLAAAFAIVREEMRKTAEEGEKTLGSLSKAIAGAGDIAHYREISGALEEMKGRGAKLFSMEERGAVYESVRGSLPLAKRERVLQLTETALEAGAIFGGDVESTKRIGGVIGELQKVMPGAERGDLGDLAVFLTQAAGKHGRELDRRAFKGVGQLTAAGVASEDALAMLVAAQESAQGAAGLTSYASWVAGGGKGRIPAAAAAVKAQMGKRDYVGMIREAQAGDLMASQIAAARGDPDLQALSLARSTAAYEKMTEYEDRARAMEVAAGRHVLEASMRRQGVSGPRRAVHRTAYDIYTVLPVDPGAAMRMAPGGKQARRRWELETMTPEQERLLDAKWDRIFRAIDRLPGAVRDGAATGVGIGGPELGRDPGEAVENE